MNIRRPFSCALALGVVFASLAGDPALAGPALPNPTPGVSARSGDVVVQSIVKARAGTRRIGRHTNVNVNRRTTVIVRRPVRVWSPRPYYGTIIAGVTLGTIIAVSAAAAAPKPPAPNLCWFWSNSTQTRGYWDYCAPPR